MHEEVKTILTERYHDYSPSEDLWDSMYLCSLRAEAKVLDRLILDTIPDSGDPVFYSNAEDYENDLLIETTESSVFKSGTNFSPEVYCKVGAKVMFLTNALLKTKGISNGSLGVITEIRNGDVNVSFPIRTGIEVCQWTRSNEIRGI